ncbi:hypothetical protein [Pseudomonas sp. C 49-2]|uniref:hypothetical protein n=1 Tax=Pseudomonas sp. C 49-2 TaxID=2496849 RepID=UPI002114C7FD|nr:hypothetical protein [Pseudomonas sp. C 49-2]
MKTLRTAFPAAFPLGVSRDSETALSDIEFLHRISLDLIGEQHLKALSGKIVDAGLSITGSPFGTLQLLCPEGRASGRLSA